MNKFIEFITPEAIFPEKKAVIALGVFDGVHPGHRKVAAAAAELSAALLGSRPPLARRSGAGNLRIQSF